MAFKLDFIATVPRDLSAGMWGFSDRVSITFEDTSPDAETVRDATEYFREAIREWYDGGFVETLEEHNAKADSIESAKGGRG